MALSAAGAQFDLGEHLAAIVQSSYDAIVSKDLGGRVKSWNPAAERIFGYTADEIVGEPILKIIPADRQEEETKIISRIRHGEIVEPFDTVRRRKDGTVVEVCVTVSPVKNPLGSIVGASKIARDISVRRRHADVQDLLMRELRHRIRNTLGMVQALAVQTFREAPPHERVSFVGRLRALAGAHDLLSEKNWEAATVGSIADIALHPFLAPGSRRIVAAGPQLPVRPQTAIFLALMFHELGTNAVKYGALSNDAGEVKVSWNVDETGDPKAFVLRWEELRGPAVQKRARMAGGIAMLERALKGANGSVQFHFAPSGLICAARIPLEQ